MPINLENTLYLISVWYDLSIQLIKGPLVLLARLIMVELQEGFETGGEAREETPACQCWIGED